MINKDICRMQLHSCIQSSLDNNKHCISVDFLLRLAITHYVGFASAAVYRCSQTTPAITCWSFLDIWVEADLAGDEQRNREHERLGMPARRKRKHSIVCPAAVASRRGVNSDSFQRDGQLNLRAASLQAMAILFCLRRPLWASTESSI